MNVRQYQKKQSNKETNQPKNLFYFRSKCYPAQYFEIRAKRGLCRRSVNQQLEELPFQAAKKTQSGECRGSSMSPRWGQ